MSFFTHYGREKSVLGMQMWHKTQRQLTSYEKLLSHIRSAHPDYSSLVESEQASERSTIDHYFSSSKAQSFMGWFDFIIHNLLPFSFLEKETIRTHIKHASISLATFMRYLPRLVECVEEKVSRLLPTRLALLFDGWSVVCTH